VIEFDHGNYHAEWVHDDDTGKLTVYILDGSAKQVAPIAADSITIEKKIGDKAETYQLPAMDRGEGKTESGRFEITDKPLIEALKSAGKGVDATLTVEIAGEKLTGKIVHHDHDHGHKH
jgi:hypothetical protein